MPPGSQTGTGLAALENPATPVVEIIVDDAAPGAGAIAGRWRRATGASNHHAGMSQYADRRGEVDRFRFTPDLPAAGEYEVFAWNSCYLRASCVPHRIVYAGGEATVGVNQDCRGGGTYGEWFALGRYPFEPGRGRFVEISDAGASGGTRPYIGADAVRFVLHSESAGMSAASPVDIATDAATPDAVTPEAMGPP